MNETATAVTPDIIFSDAAASKVKRLIAEENNPNLKLRIYISGRITSYNVCYTKLLRSLDIQWLS